MRRRFLFFHFPVFLLIIFSGRIFPQVPDQRHYTCYRTTGPISIDGKLDEPDWAMAEWSKDFLDITGADSLRPRFQTRFRMLWDSAFIYLGAELKEPHIWGSITKHDEVIFRDNDFELFIDPEGKGTNYYEIETNALGTTWDLMLTKAYDKGGKPLTSWDLEGMKKAIGIRGTLNDPSDQDTCWTVELALPIRVLMKGYVPRNNSRPEIQQEAAGNLPVGISIMDSAIRPSDGVQWRVNFSRVEWETKAVENRYVKKTDPVSSKVIPENNWVWSPMGVVSMHIPERWGWVEFSTDIIRKTKCINFQNELYKKISLRS